MRQLLFALFLACSFSSFCQKEDLIKYLDAYKTSEFPESRAIIADYSFDNVPEYTMSEYSSINGINFSTDVASIKGYKAIVNCKLQNKAGTFIEKRMLIVMYPDKIKKHWAVSGIREVADANYEYETSKASVDQGKFYTDKEFVYRNLSYWALMAGKILDSKKYIELAISIAKENNNASFSSSKLDFAISRIL